MGIVIAFQAPPGRIFDDGSHAELDTRSYSSELHWTSSEML